MINPIDNSTLAKPSETATLEDVLLSFRACSATFNALGNRYRQDIVMLLAQNDRLNVGQITERIPLSRPAISHHLKVLLQAGVVQVHRVSRENFYQLSLDQSLAGLRRLIEQAEVSCV